jgi:hypothetical protein
MSTRIRKRPTRAEINTSADAGPAEMDFEVTEWLESERLEHERRMQQIGCPCKSPKKVPEPRDKQRKMRAR